MPYDHNKAKAFWVGSVMLEGQKLSSVDTTFPRFRWPTVDLRWPSLSYRLRKSFVHNTLDTFYGPRPAIGTHIA
jgi:hypothetical protein